jgi:hypothetical protein
MSTPAQSNDVGITITITVTKDGVAQDLRAATAKQIIIRKASGIVLTKDAEFVTTGADGKIQYTTVAGDLSGSGRFYVQARVAYGTVDVRTEVSQFDVMENL